MVDWKMDIASFDRYDKFELKLGDKKTVTFVDNGTKIEKHILAAKGVPFPRDSFCFIVKDKTKKLEWWISCTNYGVLQRLKLLALENDNTIEGVTVVVERVSTERTETNYKITAA